MQDHIHGPPHDRQDAVRVRSCAQTLENLGDPLFVLDSELRVTSSNKAFKELLCIFQLSEPVIGQSLVEVFPSIPLAVTSEYRQVFATGEMMVRSRELSIHDRELYIETRKIPILKDGTVIRVVTVIRDVTEQHLLELTLDDYCKQFFTYRVRSEERFRSIFEASPVSICIFDEDGILTDANPACARMFGMASVSDILGFDISSASGLSEYVMEKIRHGEHVTFEWALDMDQVNANGKYETTKTGTMYIGVIVSPLRIDNQLQGWIAQMQDITQCRVAQQEVQRATDLAMEYMDMMSHDIANQLQSMVLCSGLLTEAAHESGEETVLAMLDESISECIKIIMQARKVSMNISDGL